MVGKGGGGKGGEHGPRTRCERVKEGFPSDGRRLERLLLLLGVGWGRRYSIVEEARILVRASAEDEREVTGQRRVEPIENQSRRT